MGASHADNVLENSKGRNQQNANIDAMSSPQLQAAIKAYQSNGGDINAAVDSGMGSVPQASSIGDILGHAMGPQSISNMAKAPRGGGTNQAGLSPTSPQPGQSDQLRAAVMNQMYADPRTGTSIATQQVQNNPLSSGMFGKGGIQDQRQADEADLTKNAYNWNAQDETAFGTAAGNINRQYAADQGNLARALSSRGFGSADSGVAASQFSGINGNTSDRLASAQQSLANNRMTVGMQRLSAARNAVNQAQGMAQNAMTDQFNRNMVGIGRADNQVKTGFGMDQGVQDQANKQFQQEQDSAFNPGKILGGAASAVGGSLLGPVGAAAGSALSNKIFPSKKVSAPNSNTSGALGSNSYEA